MPFLKRRSAGSAWSASQRDRGSRNDGRVSVESTPEPASKRNRSRSGAWQSRDAHQPARDDDEFRKRRSAGSAQGASHRDRGTRNDGRVSVESTPEPASKRNRSSYDAWQSQSRDAHQPARKVKLKPKLLPSRNCSFAGVSLERLI